MLLGHSPFAKQFISESVFLSKIICWYDRERLYVSELMNEFDKADKDGNVAKVIAILKKVELNDN